MLHRLPSHGRHDSSKLKGASFGVWKRVQILCQEYALDLPTWNCLGPVQDLGLWGGCFLQSKGERHWF